MNFDNPAWRAAPVRTGLRVATSLVRRAVPRWRRPAVPYDEGRSLIYADLATPAGLLLYRYGLRDPDLDLCARLLAPGDVFVDGGANIGLFTLIGAQRVGPGGKVVAFEPGSAVRRRLLDNVSLNAFAHVEVCPAALAAASGRAAFRVFEIGDDGLNHLVPAAGENGDVETVELTTLDASVAAQDCARVTLIKLDLEGAEYQALLGAARILRDHHPDILIEVEPAHLARMGSSAQAVANLLHGYGYRFFRVGWSDAGDLCLTPANELSDPASRPNVFATVDPDRSARRGVRIRSD